MARALAQFTRAMVSGDSRYDGAYDANVRYHGVTLRASA